MSNWNWEPEKAEIDCRFEVIVYWPQMMATPADATRDFAYRDDDGHWCFIGSERVAASGAKVVAFRDDALDKATRDEALRRGGGR